jgi:nickel/cobalt transporter (NiCoT) family protein
MCLIDTTDGALMLSLYVQPATNFLKRDDNSSDKPSTGDHENLADMTAFSNARDPIAFLYYSIILTALTVIVAVIIGILQLLNLILNVAGPEGKFWDGVETAGDNYDKIGGGICGSFIVFGLISVALYKPWRRWIETRQGS